MTERESRSAREAPTRIWLNICDEADCDGSFASHDAANVCWSEGESALLNAVEYVRATPPAEGPAVELAHAVLESSARFPKKQPSNTVFLDYRDWEFVKELARNLLAATPPAAGPVVWLECDRDGEELYLHGERLGRGMWEVLDPAALGLAPGECKRFRLTVEGASG